MDSTELTYRLERARNAVAEGDTNIQHQRDLIDRLKKAGEDTEEARVLLDTLLKRQAERRKNLAIILRRYPSQS